MFLFLPSSYPLSIMGPYSYLGLWHLFFYLIHLFFVFIITCFTHYISINSNDRWTVFSIFSTSLGEDPLQLAGFPSVPFRAWQSCSSYVFGAILFLLGNLVGWNVPTKLLQLQSFDDYKASMTMMIQSFISLCEEWKNHLLIATNLQPKIKAN